MSTPQLTDPNTPLRMYIALKMLRAWGGTRVVDAAVNKWIDAGMQGPIPFPDSAFFAHWAKDNGYSNIDGYVGFRCVVQLTSGAEDGGAV